MNTAYPLPIPKSPPMTFTVKIKIALLAHTEGCGGFAKVDIYENLS